MIEVVCGVIRNSKGEYLACLRPEGKHLAGLWEFPGGKVDPGEEPECALVRELREELSVEVVVGQKLDPVMWNYGEKMIRLTAFFCHVSSGEIYLTEHAALFWFTADNFQDLTWAEADMPILQQIFPPMK